MKKNLVYILTLITIVVALNYIHIHSDPYPDCHDNQEPFFSCWLKESPTIDKIYMTHGQHQEFHEQPQHPDAQHREYETIEEQTS